jgi:hypothetical protein
MASRRAHGVDPLDLLPEVVGIVVRDPRRLHYVAAGSEKTPADRVHKLVR